MQQPDGNTCLPTSLLMAMNFLGRAEFTTETVYALHKTCSYDRYNVPPLVQQFGLHAFPSWLEHAWTRETVEAELRSGRPVVLGLDCSRAGHFVLAVGYTDDGKVIIHDPYWKEPGWQFGGPFVTTDWAPLIWRNGIMVRPEPFPEAPRAVSGSLVETTAPRTLTRGELAYAEFAVKNNGREAWPDEVYLAGVDAYTSLTAERPSPFAILPGAEDAAHGTWLTPSRAAAPDKKNLAPGEIAYFKVPLRAPTNFPHEKSQTFRENFNLVDGTGRIFSDHWQTGPSNREIFFRVAVVAKSNVQLPLVETAAGGVPTLPWKLKNDTALTTATDVPPFPARASLPAAEDVATSAPAIALEPPAAGTALRVKPPENEDYEIAYIGDPKGKDYRVEAWVYCDYRPHEKGTGYDRVGIFVRDSGQHRLTHKSELENGESIYMAYDTDNGRVHMSSFADGGGAPMVRGEGTFIKESGWHRFAVNAQDTTITFELDGKQIATARIGGGRRREPAPPGRYQEGDCGIFVRSTYPDPAARQRGGVFAGFRLDPIVQAEVLPEGIGADADHPTI